MPSFEIPGGPSRLEFMGQSVDGKPVKTATITYTVNNRTQQKLTARLKVSPVGDAKAEWFQIQGERERVFAAAETQTITVTAKKPADPSSSASAEKGVEYDFRLVVMNVNDPGNDYAESSVSTLVEKGKPPTTGCPYCPYIAIAAALVLVVGGAAWYFLRPPPPVTLLSVPDVVAQSVSCDLAVAFLKGEGHEFTSTCTPAAAATGKEPGIVIAQDPEANKQLEKAVEIKLTSDPGVAVPNVSNRNLTFQQAFNELFNAGLDAIPPTAVPTASPPFDRVVDQEPKGGATVAKGAEVRLSVTVERARPCVPVTLCVDLGQRFLERNKNLELFQPNKKFIPD
jgi:hypothetical protein